MDATVVSRACVSYEDSIHDLGLCNNPVNCCTARLPDQEDARAGCSNILLCQHPIDALRDLNQYLSIKASDPGHTDAYILCPHMPHAPWSPQTKGLVQVGEIFVLMRSLPSMTPNMCCGMTPVEQNGTVYPLPACRHRFKRS